MSSRRVRLAGKEPSQKNVEKSSMIETTRLRNHYDFFGTKSTQRQRAAAAINRAATGGGGGGQVRSSSSANPTASAHCTNTLRKSSALNVNRLRNSNLSKSRLLSRQTKIPSRIENGGKERNVKFLEQNKNRLDPGVTKYLVKGSACAIDGPISSSGIRDGKTWNPGNANAKKGAGVGKNDGCEEKRISAATSAPQVSEKIDMDMYEQLIRQAGHSNRSLLNQYFYGKEPLNTSISFSSVPKKAKTANGNIPNHKQETNNNSYTMGRGQPSRGKQQQQQQLQQQPLQQKSSTCNYAGYKKMMRSSSRTVNKAWNQTDGENGLGIYGISSNRINSDNPEANVTDGNPANQLNQQQNQFNENQTSESNGRKRSQREMRQYYFYDSTNEDPQIHRKYSTTLHATLNNKNDQNAANNSKKNNKFETYNGNEKENHTGVTNQRRQSSFDEFGVANAQMSYENKVVNSHNSARNTKVRQWMERTIFNTKESKFDLFNAWTDKI